MEARSGANRCCSPLHEYYARGLYLNFKLKSRSELRLFIIWSGKRDSNSRPRPWQGRALPAELFPLERCAL